MRISIGRALKLFLLALIILALDITTKYLTKELVPLSMWSASIYPYGGIGVFQSVIGVDLCISHVTNTGGPLGVVSSHHNFLLLTRIFAIICLIAHLLYFNKVSFRQLPFVFIISGAIGNVLDSFFYGHVIDMIHFYFFGYSMPVFNVADAFISIGVVMILSHACFQKYKEQENQLVDSSDSPFNYEP
jgi:signal peptidase II